MLIQANSFKLPHVVEVDRFPDRCPACKMQCYPIMRYAFIDERPFKDLQVVFQCPADACYSLFIARYRIRSSPPNASLPSELISVTTLHYAQPRQFSPSVLNLSPDFCRIYHEAEVAEANGLRTICGVGYRKAFEFLVKDFIIKCVFPNDNEQQESIKKASLGNCIKTYIDDDRIRTVAERAAWLGNNEAHYVRLWQDQDVIDLKRLINMTVNWVELVLESAAYQKAMPDGKSDPAAATLT